MSMYKDLRSIREKLWNDETLMRLLYYPVKSIPNNIPDPLDRPSSDNIIVPNDSTIEKITKMWNIRDDSIYSTSKSSDLEESTKCRIYLYAGNREPSNNYLIADQEVVLDIMCHHNFEKDLRSTRISDRINELLVHERIAGMGKADYVTGHQIKAPLEYVGYRHVFTFGSFKK